MHIGFLFNSKYHSYSRLVLFYFEAQEHITSHSLVGAVCTYPVWTSTSWHVGAVLVLLPPTPWHFLVLPPGTEWAGGPGLALLSGLSCCTGQLSGKPVPAPQASSPPSSGEFAPGHERPCGLPDSSSSFQFVLFSNCSYLWLRLFYKCHLIFVKKNPPPSDLT